MLLENPAISHPHHRLRVWSNDSHYFTGRSAVLDEYLDELGINLRELADDLDGWADDVVSRRAALGPVLFEQETLNLWADVAGCFYASKQTDRAILRLVFDRVKGMRFWHVHPIWGAPSWDAFAELEASHVAVHGRQPAYVIQDLFARKIRRAAIPYVFAAADHQCQRCGASYCLQLDHIIPISKGGLNYGLNFQALCRRCNLQKHDDTWWPGMEPKP